MGRGSKYLHMPPDPYLIPGYAGHIPSYKQQVGETFAHATHNLFFEEPRINSRACLLAPVNPNEAKDDPLFAAIDELRDGPRLPRRTEIYRDNMKTGYAGHTPYRIPHFGLPYPKETTLGLADFERDQKKYHCFQKELDMLVALQDGRLKLAEIPKCIQIPPMTVRYGAPLHKAAQDMEPYKKPCPQTEHTLNPYDMEIGHPNKYYIPGYMGHIPGINNICGKNFSETTREALEAFMRARPYYRADNDPVVYKKKYDARTFPVEPDPELRPIIHVPPSCRGTVLGRLASPQHVLKFPVELGLSPRYGGHVPGIRDMAGMTFGKATRDLVHSGCRTPLRKVTIHPEEQTQQQFVCQPEPRSYPYFPRNYYEYDETY